MNREELIKELEELDKRTRYWRGGIDYDVLADFILEDRKRICAPLIDANNAIRLYGGKNHYAIKLFAIKETLKLAGLDKDMEGGK